jgi:hypothetical protein
MIRGLQICVRGDELSRRIDERIDVHQAAFDSLVFRTKRREGDQPYDVRVDDGMTTLAELEKEREDVRSRLSRLTLIRNGLDQNELYTLGLRDLRLADLIPRESSESNEFQWWGEDSEITPIVGLKLTMPGDEVRKGLAERIEVHRKRAERWKREQNRTPEQETEDAPLLPEHICENEAEREEWLIEALTFIRDHVESNNVYRLSERDLLFAELLPEKPGWLEQEECEQKNALRLHVEQVARGKVAPPCSFGAPSEPEGRDDV